MLRDKPPEQPRLGKARCAPRSRQSARGVSASIMAALCIGLQHPTRCPFEPAPQPAQWYFLILLINLSFGIEKATRALPHGSAGCWGKRLLQGREGSGAGGQTLPPRHCVGPTKLPLQARGGAEKGSAPSLAKVGLARFFQLIPALLLCFPPNL